jgi:predicted RNA-binding protein (virulence factor B family)
MVAVGKINTLPVLRSSEFGLFLDGGKLGDVLLPKRYVSKDWKPGDSVEVFVMLDSEDRLTATTLRPYAMVDEFANLRVVSVTGIGAFLDWGLPKDLLVPFREQKIKMREGQSYMVRIYLDRVSGRLVASSKLDKFLDQTEASFEEGEKVELLVAARTDLGYKAIINGTHWGMVFHNEVFQPLERGQHLDGFIKQLRPDGKIDLCLQKPGYEKVTDLAGIILHYLENHGGSMPVTGKSSPEEIHALFGVSKKTYKQAIGALYKKRLIEFSDSETKLVQGSEK